MIEENLKAILAECKARRPALNYLFESRALLTMERHAEELFAPSSTTISQKCLEVIGRHVDQRLGRELAETTVDQLSRCASVDTSAHGGILSEASAVQAYLLQTFGAQAQGYKILLALACGVIPLNNGTWPRGYFTDGEKQSIFPNEWDKVLLYNCPPFDERLLKGKLINGKTVDPKKEWLVSKALNLSTLFSPEIIRFTDQATRLNHFLFSEAFSGYEGLPSLIQLPLEEVTVELLKESLAAEDEFYAMLFEPSVRDYALRTFNGVQGAWTEERGTKFFWAVERRNHQRALQYQDGTLYSAERRFELRPEVIKDALDNRQIVPGVLLSLLLLVKHGVKCLGGYHQIHYLGEMKRKMMELLTAFNYTLDVVALDSREEPGNFSYGALFAFTPQGPAGMNAFIEKRVDLLEARARMQRETLERGCYANLPQWYRELVPAAERLPELEAVTSMEIAEHLGLL